MTTPRRILLVTKRPSIERIDDQSIRRFGLGSMIFGIFLLYLVN